MITYASRIFHNIIYEAIGTYTASDKSNGSIANSESQSGAKNLANLIPKNNSDSDVINMMLPQNNF